MLCLSLDSSRLHQSFSLFDLERGELFSSEVLEAKSSSLVHLLQSKIGSSISKIRALGLSSGPGSFTGIRAAITIAKTMAIELDIPVFCVNNFDLLRFENNISANSPLAFSAGKFDYYVSLDSDYQNPESNFFSVEKPDFIYEFKSSDLSSLIKDFWVYKYNEDSLLYSRGEDLVPYYLREPSIGKTK